MKYLITGCCGFLGTNLALKLLSQGHEIYGIDNFITGSKNNLEKLTKYDKFTFDEIDVCEIKHFKNPDYIFNLACPASPVHYSSFPIETMNTCYIGLKNLLEYCQRANIPIFQSSTSEVYGDALVWPQTEDYYGNVNCYGPRSCYDCGKRISETLCYEFSKIGTNVHIARIFNTYGPYMQTNDGRVISEFINKALNNKNLIINGDGFTTRSFCYVDDMIDIILKFSNSEFYNKPINIGNQNEFTLIDLASLIIKIANSQSNIEFHNFKKDDPKRRKPDISLAKKILKCEPKIDLKKGLKYTIEYFNLIRKNDI